MKTRFAISSALIGLLFSGVLLGAVLQDSAKPDELQIQRLAGLCKLWGAIKFFHPYLAYKPIDWDQALVQSIPQVKASVTAEDYRKAVDHMLSFLQDPMTRTVEGNAVSAAEGIKDISAVSSAGEITLQWPKDSVALITVKNYFLFTNPEKAAELARDMNDASKADTIILDIRRKEMPPAGDDATALFYFSQAFLQGLPALFQGECALPSTRHRVHSGYPPQLGSTSGGYTSGFFYDQALAIQGRNPKKAVLIFIVDGRPTGVESEMSGLQSSGKAFVVQEGRGIQETGGELYDMALPGGAAVKIRMTETVNPDGSIGFSPAVIAAARTAGSDPALTAAMDISQGKSSFPQSKASILPPNPSLVQENPYTDMAYPSEEYRLLSLFRFWNVIHYFYPYKQLMDRPWDATLEEFIPRLQGARDGLDYTLRVMELVTRINDSHGGASSPIFMSYVGTHCPPIEVKWIEEQTVVTHVFKAADGSLPKVGVGDVVLAVDGEDISARRERLGRYFAASTPQALQRRIHLSVLNGAENSDAKIKVRDGRGMVSEITARRTLRFLRSERTTPVYGVLPQGYGYMDLVRLQVTDVDKAFEAVRNTLAIIMDMRGYPQGTAWSLGPRLTDKKTIVAQFIRQELHAGAELDNPLLCTEEATTEPGGKWRYPGRVVVLINEEAISQSEHTCLFLEAAAHARFIGSPTVGANGDVTRTILPGRILVNFTGIDVRHGDGRQLQRIGILPDVPVKPTIAGIRQGCDEVLERAIEELRKTGK